MDVPLFFKRKKCRSWEVLQQKNMVQHIMFVKLFFLQLESWVSNNENDDSKKRQKKKYGVMKESVEKTIYFKGG